MRKTIWKFELAVNDRNNIKMPVGAEILTVQVQNEAPCIWAMVEPDSGTEVRHFRTFGTGHEIPDGAGQSYKYIGTYQLMDGQFVGHLFEYNS